MNIFGKKIRFKNPEKADIVIFDECNCEYVRRVLDAKYKVEVFKMRPYEIWIAPVVVYNFIININQIKIKDAIVHSSGLLYGLLFQLRSIYFEACIVAMSPRAVVTIIDNSSSFHWLSRYSRKFPYIAIQNGDRLRYAVKENKEFYLQHYFCWGAKEAKIFNDLGYKVEKYYPVGSLLASLYFKNQFEASKLIKYDLLIVSSWRGNIGLSPDVIDTMRSMKMMDEFLSEYIKNRSIKAGIVLRSERNSNDWIMQGIGSEYDYYDGIYGDAVDIIEANFVARSVYPAMQQSRLVVSCLSSAVNEVYGLGQKVLFFNYTGSEKYHCDIDPKCVINETNLAKVMELIDELLDQSECEYQRLHSDSIKMTMAYPDDFLTHKIIKSKIEEIVNS